MSPQGPPGYRGSAADDERGDINDPTVHTRDKLAVTRPTDPMPPIEGPVLVEDDKVHHKLRMLPKMTAEQRETFGIEPDEGPKPNP